jgi:hypothetical protein
VVDKLDPGGRAAGASSPAAAAPTHRWYDWLLFIVAGASLLAFLLGR